MTIRFLLVALLILAGCSKRQIPYVDRATPRDLASFDRAIDSLTAVAQAKPDDSDPFNRLGLMQYKKAKWMYEMMKYRVDFQMQRVRGKIEAIADEATRNFDKALRLRPAAAEAYKNKAMVCVLKNEWQNDDEVYMRNCRDALKFLRNADSLRPGSSEIWYWKGVAYSRFYLNKGAMEAVRCFEKAVELDSANPRAACSLAEQYAWASAADYTRLVDLYSRVARAELKNAELMRIQSDLYGWVCFEADRAYWNSLKSVPAFMKPMVFLGLRAFGSNSTRTRVREDIARSGLAIAEDYWCLVEAYSESNTGKSLDNFKNLLAVSEYPISIERSYGKIVPEPFYEKAAKLEPSLPWIYFYQAKYTLTGSVQQTRLLLLKSTELDPGFTLAFYLLGIWSFEQKDFDNAMTWLKLVIDRKPVDDFAALNAHQLMTLISLNKGDVTKAIEEYQASLKLDSSFAEWNLQHQLFGRGQGIPFLPERAIPSDAHLGGRDKKVASMLNVWASWSCEPRVVEPFDYGFQMKRTGYLFNKKPEQSLRNAIDLDPDNEEAYLRLATYYEFSTRQRVALNYGTGNFYTITPISKVDEAIKVLRLFLNRHPESRKAHFQLGQYYTQKKLFGKAEEEYKSAARLGSPLALDELERMGEHR